MPRKKGKTASHSTHHNSHEHSHIPDSLEGTLIKNIIELQKVHTDLAEKFDKLSKEISGLLNLFETTAKSFAGNVPMGEYQKDKEFLEKIDKLLDQNKVLAKGLTLMEERLREKMYGQVQQQAPQESQIRQAALEGYRASISSNRPPPKF